jgi:hypothetical protein
MIPRARSSANKVPIQSVVRAIAVLEALGRKSDGVGLVDLSRTVGLHKATVFRLLRTMMVLGYVVQTGDRKLYSISDLFRRNWSADRSRRRRRPGQMTR